MTRPKYQEVFDHLAVDIRTGKFGELGKLPSEAALMRKFNTSRITVGRALRELQNKGMIERIAGSGSYVRQAQRGGEPLLFGLLIPDLGETEIFDAICQGIANAQGSVDHALLWGHANPLKPGKEERALELCRQFVQRKVSGVFFAPLEFETGADKTNRQILSGLQEAGIPVVLLDRRNTSRAERGRPDLVGLNNRQAGYIAAEHLIQLGCRRIGFLGYHGAESTIAARMRGYEEALRAHGLPVMMEEESAAAADTALEAFVCVNDRMAGQLMHTLLSAGTRIPEDVRLVGIDDASFATMLPVPLTTVRQPSQEIGEAALATMLQRIERPKAPARDVLLDGELIVRKSCGAQLGSGANHAAQAGPSASPTSLPS